MARPKTISDTELLNMAYNLIMEHGPQGLTFSSLATMSNLVPAALVKRFRNKQQLLARVDQYALQRTDKALEGALQHQDSPIEAIIELLTTELAFATSTKRFINGQQFLLTDLADPELYINYRNSFEKRQRQLTHLLQSAQEKGELIPGMDCVKLAKLLQAIQQGAGHTWVMSQDESIAVYIDRYVRQALEPFLNKHMSLEGG